MSDDELLAELTRVLDMVDTARPSGIEEAKAALALSGDLDAELARLTFDSSIDQPGSALVLRSDDASTRQLTFTADELTIDIEIGPRGVMGQIIPPQPASIELVSTNGSRRTLEADKFGVFSTPDIEPGPITLVARAPDGSWSVRTAWTAT